MKSFLVATAIAAAGLALTTPAQADGVMKVCGAKYQAAKAAKTLPAGQTWNQFLAACRGSTKAPAAAPAPMAAPVAAAAPAKPSMFSRWTKPAVAAAPAAAPAAPAVTRVSHLPSPQSPAMTAMHDRQRQCGAQWKADKAAGKIPAGQTWPKYWSACNTRLKA